MDSTQQAFVQAVEVWTPDGNMLQRQSGAYGQLTEFAEASADLTLEKGQGLPGAAYRSMRPEVWHELGIGFVRQQSARLSGLSAAGALPWFRGNTLTAVVVFLCGSREQTGGCIEVWEPNELRELALTGGYYGQLEAFAEISRLIRFQRGRGLPGLTWESGTPHIIPDLRSSSAFIRAAAAKSSGVTSGLGFPLYCGHEIAHILLLLSAQATPLARAFEVWSIGPDGALYLDEFFYARELGLAAEAGRPPPCPPGEGLAIRVAETKLPFASPAPHTLQPVKSAAPGRTSFQLGLGIPIHDGERLRAVVNLLS
jgi:hypothetical protein